MDGAWPYLAPIAGAVLAGGLIGFEREYRGRPAGFRTHILVSLASALLMLAAVRQVEWMPAEAAGALRIDPVRMAHGILTGVGFLCGGVIFRDRFSVHGLTTAASLWTTSAIGTLYGVGAWGLAIAGTLAALAVLAVLRLVEDRLPRRVHADITLRAPRGQALDEAAFAALLAEHRLTPTFVAHRLLDHGMVELSAVVRGPGPLQADALSRRLQADPRIAGFEIAPRQE